MKQMSDFLSENFQFLVVKFSIYLNRRVHNAVKPVLKGNCIKQSPLLGGHIRSQISKCIYIKQALVLTLPGLHLDFKTVRGVRIIRVFELIGNLP